MPGDVETPFSIPKLYIWSCPDQLSEIVEHQNKPLSCTPLKHRYSSSQVHDDSLHQGIYAGSQSAAHELINGIIQTTILGLLAATAFAIPMAPNDDILAKRQGSPPAVGCPGKNGRECQQALSAPCSIACSMQGAGALGCLHNCLSNAAIQCSTCKY